MNESINTIDLPGAAPLERLRRTDRPAGRAQRSHVAPALEVV